MENYELIFEKIMGKRLELLCARAFITDDIPHSYETTLRADRFPIIKDPPVQGKTFKTAFGTFTPHGDTATVHFDLQAIIYLQPRPKLDYKVSAWVRSFDCSTVAPNHMASFFHFNDQDTFIDMERFALVDKEGEVIPLKDARTFMFSEVPLFYTTPHQWQYFISHYIKDLAVGQNVYMHLVDSGKENVIPILEEWDYKETCSATQILLLAPDTDYISAKKVYETFLPRNAKNAWAEFTGASDVSSLQTEQEIRNKLEPFMKDLVASLQKVLDDKGDEIIVSTANFLSPLDDFSIDSLEDAKNYLLNEFEEHNYSFTGLDGEVTPLFTDKNLITIANMVKDKGSCHQYGGPILKMPLETEIYFVNYMMFLVFQEYLLGAGIYNCPMRFCTLPYLTEEKCIPF